jgi:hypothetical protein
MKEQHNIRHDMMPSAEDAHLKLAHCDKVVVVPVREVHKTHGRASLAGLAVLADTGVFQQQGKSMTVVFDQIAAREAGCCRGRLCPSPSS